MGVQQADRLGAEPDRPVAVVPLGEPHRLADEGLAQVEVTATPLDLAIGWGVAKGGSGPLGVSGPRPRAAAGGCTGSGRSRRPATASWP